MDILTKAFKIVAGSKVKNALSSLTRNRFVAVLTGTIATAILNSSSATTVILVGFVSAGLITATQSVGVIMGANIGGTLRSQIIAFNISGAALPMAAFGFFLSFLGTKEKVKEYGNMILGFGLIFYGMFVMSDAMKPLRYHEPFMNIMASIDNVFIGILIGTIFTAIVQSSAATAGIAIVMAGQGLLNLPLAISIVLGANIGTCITALLSVIGKTREAVRTAIIHIVFNVVGVIIWVGFIDKFADAVVTLSPISHHLEGNERLRADLPRQIANGHTIFNVLNTIIFIWFAPLFVKVSKWFVPEKPKEQDEFVQRIFIGDALLEIPKVALSRCRMEIGVLGESVMKMYDKIMPAVIIGENRDLDTIVKMDECVDSRYGFIVDFLGKLVKMTEHDQYQTEEIMELLQVTNHFETMGDIIETGLVSIGKRRIDEGVVVSNDTRNMLESYHKNIRIALEKIIVAVRENNMEIAKEIYEMKEEMSKLTLHASRHQALRLCAPAPNRLQTYTREMEIIENIGQIYKLSRRIAKAMIKSHNNNQ